MHVFILTFYLFIYLIIYLFNIFIFILNMLILNYYLNFISKVYNLKYDNVTITAAKAIYGPQLNAEQVWDMDILPIFKNSNFSKPTLSEGCSEYSSKYKEIIKGKVIMVSRGSCFFSEKTKYAMKAGAAGIIISNINEQIFSMSPYKETKFNPLQYKDLINKFKELEQEVMELVENDIPYHKRKQEVDEYTIPSLMISKQDSESLLKKYLEPLLNYRKNEFKNLLKLYETFSTIHGTLSWNLMGFKFNDLIKIKPVDLQYDGKIISNIKIIKTRRRKVLDITPLPNIMNETLNDINNRNDNNNKK